MREKNSQCYSMEQNLSRIIKDCGYVGEDFSVPVDKRIPNLSVGLISSTYD